ncbi:hypothetical protein ACFYUR_18845 [Micromonospora haikouensis]|uniref:hypothetical protein n=1 Tax=Micromonospora haikouensis TaxID=686309 RepID=UPI003699B969
MPTTDDLAARAAKAIADHYAADLAIRDTMPADPTSSTEASYVDQRARSYRAAADVVTAAVRAGVPHWRIADLAGCGGLTVIDMIDDRALRTAAYVSEKHRARRHLDAVEQAIRDHARRVIGAQNGRGKTQLTRELGISRPTLDAWLEADEG